ncbi:transcriptional regulator CecR [Symbiopectobacterium purcellii]|uniref:Transcriptional regulator CecR n=1 Tax=Symbiopectobacterium purcellii TaxID=2871826 RepID=A0ABX9ATZ1_9ENTR|nr:transcriptional regulator CecR [Symbiopectobacterium purcellii]QZN97245.1 transcriptional regulator CecR [Symbiopectobacterium purcellii]
MLFQATSPTRGDHTKQRLLQAALEVFGEFGLQAATTRDIARRAGQNIAAITYHFHSKEGLYRAVASAIADEVAHTYLPLRTEITEHLQQPAGTPERYMAYLQKLVLNFTRLMTSPETLHFSRFMSREQLSPTDAYPLMHERIIAPMHQLMTQLVAGYTGLDSSDRRTVIHAHALIGEALAFRFARETIRLRAGWDDVGLEQSLVINDVVTQHIALVLDGLRAAQQRECL